MFMGNSKNSIDTKYRMIVPSKFREELGFKCVVTRGIDTCLYIYPMDKWQDFAEKLNKLPKTDKKARNFSRHFFANAEETEIDKQGRVTIPSALREYGKIEKELMTIGYGDKIEVWSRDLWESSNDISQIGDEDIAEGMEQYGI